jgi:hypothetical protein
MGLSERYAVQFLSDFHNLSFPVKLHVQFPQRASADTFIALGNHRARGVLDLDFDKIGIVLLEFPGALYRSK